MRKWSFVFCFLFFCLCACPSVVGDCGIVAKCGGNPRSQPWELFVGQLFADLCDLQSAILQYTILKDDSLVQANVDSRGGEKRPARALNGIDTGTTTSSALASHPDARCAYVRTYMCTYTYSVLSPRVRRASVRTRKRVVVINN